MPFVFTHEILRHSALWPKRSCRGVHSGAGLYTQRKQYNFYCHPQRREHSTPPFISGGLPSNAKASLIIGRTGRSRLQKSIVGRRSSSANLRKLLKRKQPQYSLSCSFFERHPLLNTITINQHITRDL